MSGRGAGERVPGRAALKKVNVNKYVRFESRRSDVENDIRRVRRRRRLFTRLTFPRRLVCAGAGGRDRPRQPPSSYIGISTCNEIEIVSVRKNSEKSSRHAKTHSHSLTFSVNLLAQKQKWSTAVPPIVLLIPRPRRASFAQSPLAPTRGPRTHRRSPIVRGSQRCPRLVCRNGFSCKRRRRRRRRLEEEQRRSLLSHDRNFMAGKATKAGGRGERRDGMGETTLLIHSAVSRAE